MAKTKKQEPKQEGVAVTRAEKMDATKNLIKEVLAIQPIKHNDLLDEVAKLYTQRYGADTDNVNDVKGRVGSVLDIMKKNGDVGYEGGIYALKARLPMPAPTETLTEIPDEKPVKKTVKKSAKKEEKTEEKSVEKTEEKPLKKETKKKAVKSKKDKEDEPALSPETTEEEKKIPLPPPPIQPIAPVAPITPEVAPEPIPEKTEKPKRASKKKAEKGTETPTEKPAKKAAKKSAVKEEKTVETPAVKGEEKPAEAPAETNAEIKSEIKPEIITETKPEPKSEGKSEVMDMSFLFGTVKPAKTEEKEEQKPEEKEEQKLEEKPAPKAEEKSVQPTLKTETKAEQKPAQKPQNSVQQKQQSSLQTGAQSRVLKTVKQAVQKPMSAEEKLRDNFLKKLRSLGGDYFEYYSVYLLEKYSRKNGRRLESLKISGGERDGGIDGEIELTDRLGFRETIYIQSKNWDPQRGDERLWVVGETLLQQFIGACACKQAKDGKQHTRGIFITTSNFTPDAKRILDTMSDKVVGYDGNDVFETAKECQFGLLYENGNWKLDEKLLSGAKAFFNMM